MNAVLKRYVKVIRVMLLLATGGVFISSARSEENPSIVVTQLDSTTLSGYVSVSVSIGNTTPKATSSHMLALRSYLRFFLFHWKWMVR